MRLQTAECSDKLSELTNSDPPFICSKTIDTHPAGIFQCVASILTRWSFVLTPIASSHSDISSLNTALVSHELIGISFTLYTCNEGMCNIFLTGPLPDELRLMAKVIIWSRRKLSLDWPNLKSRSLMGGKSLPGSGRVSQLYCLPLGLSKSLESYECLGGKPCVNQYSSFPPSVVQLWGMKSCGSLLEFTRILLLGFHWFCKKPFQTGETDFFWIRPEGAGILFL